MIKNSNITDEILIRNYLNNCYYKSPYLYLNFDKYKFSNPNIKTYTQVDDHNNIICLLSAFGNTLHILSNNDNAFIPELYTFIYTNNYSVICTDGSMANSIYNNFGSGVFDISIGKIFELKELNNDIIVDNRINVIRANENDYVNIVDLLMQDEEKKKVYTKDSLYNQIKNCNIEKYGRNYIIKENNKVIAHAGTGAENSSIAVLNFLIIDTEYRRKGLAAIIIKKLCEDLISEGKVCYIMVLNNELERVYKRFGFYEKSTYGKLIRK